MNLFSSLRNSAENWAAYSLDRQDGACARAVVLVDPITGVPYSAGSSRVCLGHQNIPALSAVTAASLTVPNGAVCAEIQADGGVVRLRRDAVNPTATNGWRIDDGMSVVVDSVLASVRLLAQSGVATNVQVSYYDRV